MIKTERWRFDAKVAASFKQIAQREIPDYQRVIDLCLRLIRKDTLEQPKIIDVGSATGETLKQLHQAGYHNLYGVDASSDMLTKSFNKATLIHSDTFPESYGPFDYVLNNWTLHFIHAPEAYLAAIKRSLTTNGTLILTNKVSSSPRIHSLYDDYKRHRGMSEAAISRKRQQLDGVLVTQTVQWHLDTLAKLGFKEIEIINANAAFVTFMCINHA